MLAILLLSLFKMLAILLLILLYCLVVIFQVVMIQGVYQTLTHTGAMLMVLIICYCLPLRSKQHFFMVCMACRTVEVVCSWADPEGSIKSLVSLASILVSYYVFLYEFVCAVADTPSNRHQQARPGMLLIDWQMGFLRTFNLAYRNRA